MRLCELSCPSLPCLLNIHATTLQISIDVANFPDLGLKSFYLTLSLTAMSSISLSQRLHALSDTYKQTLTLVQELQSFPSAQHTDNVSTSLDQQRLDLANDCHDTLKSAEDALDLLRQEVDDYTENTRARRSTQTPQDEERDRNATSIVRLAEDIKSARGAFRRAQLQSKRNLDATKRKEREQLFASRRNPTGNGEPLSPTSATARSRRAGQQRLTQDELAVNAAEDVTRALRRTHQLLSSNLSQSQFAQQTLEESQEQMKSLGERYSGTTDLLKSSRGLVKTLIGSQKSDTWYLKTSLAVLMATLGWLVFRRILFGPLWWFVWMPGKWAIYLLSSIFGVGTGIMKAGVGRSNNTLAATVTRLNVPTNPPNTQGEGAYHVLPNKGAGWDTSQQPDSTDMPTTLHVVESVTRMIDNAEKQQFAQEADGPDLASEDQPRNPKKRMMEIDEEDERKRRKDEL